MMALFYQFDSHGYDTGIIIESFPETGSPIPPNTLDTAPPAVGGGQFAVATVGHNWMISTIPPPEIDIPVVLAIQNVNNVLIFQTLPVDCIREINTIISGATLPGDNTLVDNAETWLVYLKSGGLVDVNSVRFDADAVWLIANTSATQDDIDAVKAL